MKPIPAGFRAHVSVWRHDRDDFAPASACGKALHLMRVWTKQQGIWGKFQLSDYNPVGQAAICLVLIFDVARQNRQVQAGPA
jgi:hypothetical protein